MIDFDDADDFWLAGMLTPGLAGFVLLTVFLVLLFAAAGNAKDCQKMKCPGEASSGKLIDNECLCVVRAK